MAKKIIIISLIVVALSGCAATSTNSNLVDDTDTRSGQEILDEKPVTTPKADFVVEQADEPPIEAPVVQKLKQEPAPAEPLSEVKEEPKSAPPAIQVIPPQEPVKSDPVPVSNTTTYSCAVEKACTKMSSCEEAYYHLNVCGFKKRDGDGDGVPCEDICPGG